MSAALLSIFKGTIGMDTLAGLLIVTFAAGFLFKSAIVFKQRKRILRLEDEMLGNHARILSLERRVSEQKKSKHGLVEEETISEPKKTKVTV